MRCAALVVAVLVASVPVAAQAPDAAWRTLTTTHYRVHYPAELEEWTLHAAARLESIRDRVSAVVGYAPPQRVDVVVMDPEADANGSAWPFLRWPRMLLWTSPPQPESTIGHFRDWPELLITHELAHLAHLLRPSRNPFRRWLERSVLVVGPVTVQAPRWLYEGYATLVEGRLTGAGRPNSDLRAAVLRLWAQAGRLPSYGALSGDSQSWLGMSMAYLAGSAYLEWLEERAGPDSLRHLWARLTARHERTFDEAFRGVFGDGPRELYGQFQAELTWRAMEVGRRLEPLLQEGELWQRLEWSTGEPAVSPDGRLIAAVLRQRDRPSRIVVWPTASADAELQRWRQRISAMLQRDPQDVGPVLDRPLPREPLFQLPTRNGATPHAPRWMPDGQALLFVRFEPDSRGFLHPDLFRWSPASGKVERLTRGADLRDPDPAPDGTWAVAVRNRHGHSQIVRVELGTGDVSPLTPPSVQLVYDRPRISPDGRRLAYAMQAEGRWQLVVRDLAAGNESVLHTPPEALVAHPAWSHDGRALYAAVGQAGFVDLWRFRPDEAAVGRPLTRMMGAALGPAPSADGEALFFLGLQPHGFDIRRLDLSSSTPPPTLLPALDSSFGPAVRPEPPPDPGQPDFVPVHSGTPYGFGPQELFPLLGGVRAPGATAIELGVRGGDIIGRIDYLVLGAFGGSGPKGAAVAGLWRGWPVGLGGHLYAVQQEPSAQPELVPGLGTGLDATRLGLALDARWRRLGRLRRLELDAGALFERLEPAGTHGTAHLVGFASLRHSRARTRGLWRLQHDLEGRLQLGAAGSDGWARFGGTLGLEAGFRQSAIGVQLRQDRAEGARLPFDRLVLGGLPSSLLPPAALSNRIFAPALPAGTGIGDRYSGQRAELKLGWLPGPIFFERHRVEDGSGTKQSLALVGTELRLALEPFPLVRLPGVELRAGIARILDEPFKDDFHWWLGTVWRP
jgi:hypothetical protein